MTLNSPLFIPKCKTDFKMKTLAVSGAKLYNKLPCNIRNCKSWQNLKKYVQTWQFLLWQLFTLSWLFFVLMCVELIVYAMYIFNFVWMFWIHVLIVHVLYVTAGLSGRAGPERDLKWDYPVEIKAIIIIIIMFWKSKNDEPKKQQKQNLCFMFSYI